MFKNIIIAALATFIYNSYVVEGTPTVTRVYAMICAFMCAMAMMSWVDTRLKTARYKKVHMIKKKSFERYKNWMAGVVEQKALGKSEDKRKKLVMNIITHQKKYAFSGMQISELLSLAKVEREECEASGQVCS